jgi:hypothetical protein
MIAALTLAASQSPSRVHAQDQGASGLTQVARKLAQGMMQSDLDYAASALLSM